MSKYLSCLAIGAILSILLFVHLSSVPKPSFDEGWVLSVARTWVEHGYYGQILDGHPRSASMLNVGFPAIGPIALSFRLFGIGFWQGRLPGVLCTFGAFWALYWLSKRLYDRRTAICTMVFLVFLTPFVSWAHSTLIGRQALGEMPAVFYLVSGYVCFILSLDRSPWFIGGTAMLWGLSAITKLQGAPFLTLGLLVALILVSMRRQWREARIVAITFAGFVGSYLVWKQVQDYFLGEKLLHQLWEGLIGTTAITLAGSARTHALYAFLLAGVPTGVALLWTGRKNWHFFTNGRVNSNNVVTSVLWCQVFTWLAWFLFLSVGWERYLFSPIYLGSPFCAAVAIEWTSSFSSRTAFQRTLKVPFGTRTSVFRVSIGVVGAIYFYFYIMGLSYCLKNAIHASSTEPARQVAEMLNSEKNRNPLVETCEMELFVLLSIRYHYPDEDVHMNLNRRTFLKEQTAIDYDASLSKSDYLVIGPQARLWKIYEPLIKEGKFKLKNRVEYYDIYVRTGAESDEARRQAIRNNVKAKLNNP
jgi:4-amino-4-deoxy-L-arabinose transferase-like glycosyltransferase